MEQKPVITPEQTEYLYRFCKKHYVHHYDLQTELVDHLASAIEDKLAADPQSTFLSALDEVYKGFGYSGFAKVVAQRTAELSRRNKKIRRRIFRTYFRWPRLAFTLMLALTIFTLIKTVPGYLVPLVPLTTICFMIGYNIYMSFQILSFKKRLKFELLLTADIYASPILFSFGIQYFNLSRIWGFDLLLENMSNLQIAVFVLLTTLIAVYMRTQYEFARALFAEARQLYPQAFKTAS